jgi:hypothetical protein
MKMNPIFQNTNLKPRRNPPDLLVPPNPRAKEKNELPTPDQDHSPELQDEDDDMDVDMQDQREDENPNEDFELGGNQASERANENGRANVFE